MEKHARTPEMIGFLHFLDNRCAQPKPWHSPGGWPQRFALTGTLGTFIF
jgi:hypothetical protein